MSVFHVLPDKPCYYVYAMLASETGNAYVKFGISNRIGARLSAIRTACPLPIEYIAVIDVGNKAKALEIESALHSHFVDRKSQGEWFCFDVGSDKKAFNDGCRKVFLMELGPDYWWTKINVAALDKHEKHRRKKMMESKYFGRIKKRMHENRKTDRAWKELSA